jgi:hypothetical protein
MRGHRHPGAGIVSNVLIGIIGVILFIGLALAGALILGDDFKSSNSSSRAAAISSTMQQAANAAAMYQLKTGQTLTASSTTNAGTFLVPRFLKTAPINPYTGGPLQMIDTGGASTSGGQAVMWYSNIGTDDVAKSICRAIEEGAGAANPEASQSVANVDAAGGWHAWVAANKRIGCLANKYWVPTQYQAYIWI